MSLQMLILLLFFFCMGLVDGLLILMRVSLWSLWTINWIFFLKNFYFLIGLTFESFSFKLFKTNLLTDLNHKIFIHPIQPLGSVIRYIKIGLSQFTFYYVQRKKTFTYKIPQTPKKNGKNNRKKLHLFSPHTEKENGKKKN